MTPNKLKTTRLLFQRLATSQPNGDAVGRDLSTSMSARSIPTYRPTISRQFRTLAQKRSIKYRVGSGDILLDDEFGPQR